MLAAASALGWQLNLKTAETQNGVALFGVALQHEFGSLPSHRHVRRDRRLDGDSEKLSGMRRSERHKLGPSLSRPRANDVSRSIRSTQAMLTLAGQPAFGGLPSYVERGQVRQTCRDYELPPRQVFPRCQLNGGRLRHPSTRRTRRGWKMSHGNAARIALRFHHLDASIDPIRQTEERAEIRSLRPQIQRRPGNASTKPTLPGTVQRPTPEGSGLNTSAFPPMTANDWGTGNGLLTLENSARLTAAIAARLGIPIVHLEPGQFAVGRGFVGQSTSPRNSRGLRSPRSRNGLAVGSLPRPRRRGVRQVSGPATPNRRIPHHVSDNLRSLPGRTCNAPAGYPCKRKRLIHESGRDHDVRRTRGRTRGGRVGGQRPQRKPQQKKEPRAPTTEMHGFPCSRTRANPWPRSKAALAKSHAEMKPAATPRNPLNSSRHRQRSSPASAGRHLGREAGRDSAAPAATSADSRVSPPTPAATSAAAPAASSADAPAATPANTPDKSEPVPRIRLPTRVLVLRRGW